MAYRLMKQLIALNRKTKTELLEYCDVYYAAGRLTAEQYAELITEIEALEA